jgi:hypothetical protein
MMVNRVQIKNLNFALYFFEGIKPSKSKIVVAHFYIHLGCVKCNSL